MKFVFWSVVFVPLLLLSAFVFATGIASNSDLRRTDDYCKMGDSYQQCRMFWKDKKQTIRAEYDKPRDPARQRKYIVLLHPKNHPILDEDSHLHLEFTNDKLTQKYYREFWRPFD